MGQPTSLLEQDTPVIHYESTDTIIYGLMVCSSPGTGEGERIILGRICFRYSLMPVSMDYKGLDCIGLDHCKGRYRSIYPRCAHVPKNVGTLITTASLILAEILSERLHACLRWPLTDVNSLIFFFSQYTKMTLLPNRDSQQTEGATRATRKESVLWNNPILCDCFSLSRCRHHWGVVM